MSTKIKFKNENEDVEISLTDDNIIAQVLALKELSRQLGRLAAIKRGSR